MASKSSDRLRDASIQFRTTVGQIAGTYAFLLQQEAEAALDLETLARLGDKSADGSHEYDDMIDLSKLRTKFGRMLSNAGPLPLVSPKREGGE